jgi:tRNA(fMet)-specific endonuclease VapC
MEQTESMIILDTDLLINLFDPFKSNHHFADEVLKSLLENNIEMYVSTITEIELIQGNKTAVEKRGLIKKLAFFKSFSITEEISTKAKELIFTYSSSHGLFLADAFIAATALQLEIPLFTFNKKDFKFIKNLKLYEPQK